MADRKPEQPEGGRSMSASFIRDPAQRQVRLSIVAAIVGTTFEFCDLALGYAALQASIIVFGEHSYWAWRVPFLLSAVLMIVGLYIRLGNLETPVFTRLLEERKIERFPVRQVLRQCWREVTLCFLLRAGEATSGAVFQIVIVTYATTVLRLGGPMVLGYTEAATVLSVGTVLLFGYLSDVIGIKLMYMTG